LRECPGIGHKNKYIDARPAKLFRDDIRLLFAITIFIAFASVVFKGLGMQKPSAVLIVTAGVAISTTILILLFRGICDSKKRFITEAPDDSPS